MTTVNLETFSDADFTYEQDTPFAVYNTLGEPAPVHMQVRTKADDHTVWLECTTDNGRIIITPAILIAITGVANNSGAIRITVASTSGLLNGQTVTIYDVLGTTEANGTWVISNVTATTFDLVNSVFTHAYTSGGTVIATPEKIKIFIEQEFLETLPPGTYVYSVVMSTAPIRISDTLTQLPATIRRTEMWRGTLVHSAGPTMWPQGTI